MTGNMTDAKAMITRLRMYAAQFKFKYGYHIPVQVLVGKQAEWSQSATQYVGIRAMCVVITIVGIDEEKGPQVFKIDPAGHSMGYKAISAGAKEQEAINHLEKLQKKNKDGYPTEKAIQVSISTLQSVVGTDFKADELEVGIATLDKPFFKKITTEEIEHFLNMIADEG